jgi:histidinol-phosphate aminotransferase
MTEADDAATGLVRELLPEALRARKAYHVPDASGLVKLDAMESPYPWPGALREAWCAALDAVAVNRYPDPSARELQQALRAVMGVPEAAALLLGNGSDELIQILLTALRESGRPVLVPEPTFVMYRVIAESLGMRCLGVALDPEDFSLPRERLLQVVERERPAVVFLAYPNNPTGNLWDRAAVDAVLDAAPGLVVVDEAYTPFAGASYLQELPRRPNLVVMRTVSKMGLAGLRLGWLAAAPALVAELDKVRLPYNVNALTQASARVALAHEDRLAEHTAAVRAERGPLGQALAQREGVRRVWPSDANFLLFRVDDAPGVLEGLRARGVLIKQLHGSHPHLAGCLRVTVGTPEENEAFLAALDAALA